MKAKDRRRWTLVEDPDELGYRLVCDPLLELMDADDWYALERAARAGDAAAPESA